MFDQPEQEKLVVDNTADDAAKVEEVSPVSFKRHKASQYGVGPHCYLNQFAIGDQYNVSWAPSNILRYDFI